ncbi:S9 family peptidase [Haoranjiania flava]|uniref:S9 family peptidase n=1 Tax=Haoranjiania flava TaxID=1856322 RepID=A0AAE3LNZ6_9BACT|nr:S9 family peptidase [Haoranjiania flava]MCU7695486.1 S9 family peptidase [Haoranjiania flava]
MYRNLFLFFWLIICSVPAVAQQKLMTLEEATLGRGRQFNPEDKTGMQWQDNTHFTYVKDLKDLVQHNILTGKEQTILTVNDINSPLANEKVPSLKYFYTYSWESPEVLKFTTDNYEVMFNINTRKITHKLDYDKHAANLDFHPKTKSIAYTIDNNLFVKQADGKVSQVTNDTDKGIVNASNYVHRQEFGINKGTFWSNSGHAIAYYRKDERMVADYPLVDVTKRIAALQTIKYPMAGETSEEVTLGIYNLQTGKTMYIKPFGGKNDYLTHIGWDPSDRFIYIAELNRAQNHMRFNKYDANTGAFMATLFEERNDKWVEPENDMVFMKTKPDQFLWFSERDGFTHLYLYNTSGKLLKQLTKGDFIITDFIGFDEKEENFYVMSTKDSPLERHLYKYNMKTGKETKLTRQPGTHRVALSPDKKYFTDNYSNYTTPRNIDLLDVSGKTIKNILTAKNPVAAQNYALGEMQTGTIKAADGTTDLYYRMIKPHDFDASKKYPVIVYVYGGPHAQMVTNSWLGGTGLFDYYLAQKGFIVFTVDNRGSAHRGFKFESVIHRQNGQEEMKDQIKGVEYLQSLPYVDANRIGVSGWSYGGFMATSLMTNYPDVFKAGVAGGPVIDWKYYEVMYGERYMDTPQENPEGYAKTSLIKNAKNLKGRLLMIHGDVDPVVVMQNSLSFLKAATDANVLVDYAVYPAHEHNVMGRDRVNLNKKIAQYFLDYLK